MRRLVVLGLGLALVVGCNKADESSNQEGNVMHGVHGPTGVVLDPGAVMGGGGGATVQQPQGQPLRAGTGGGGSGGAAQAVRGAVARIVDQKEMQDLYLYVNTYSLSSGQMPSAQEIFAAAQESGSTKLTEQIQNGDIILTNARSRESIWAYTKDPQNGQHIAISAPGVERLTQDELQRRLQY